VPRDPVARQKLLGAALSVFREKGYSGASVDELCARAGVTKGAFFHHFASKEELGKAAANHWSEVTGAMFAAHPYHTLSSPTERVLAYIALRKELLKGELATMTCVAGTLAQEVYREHPEIRDACGACIFGHVATLVDDIRNAKAEGGVKGREHGTPESLAGFIQATIQGAFVLAKAKDDVVVARDCLTHLEDYVRLLLRGPSMESAIPTKSFLKKLRANKARSQHKKKSPLKEK
jgi:TetR/AcrR family transcriptional repressor of nem operon